ncbi:MAG: succinate dehydrogenase assembly factor 2 [Pseudomonadota bacterium]
MFPLGGKREMMVEEDVRRMRWAARRGMLELDLVLEPFVTERYSELDQDERQSFQRLMEREDQELYGWFLQRQIPDDEALAAIVEKILTHARAQV